MESYPDASPSLSSETFPRNSRPPTQSASGRGIGATAMATAAAAALSTPTSKPLRTSGQPQDQTTTTTTTRPTRPRHPSLVKEEMAPVLPPPNRRPAAASGATGGDLTASGTRPNDVVRGTCGTTVHSAGNTTDVASSSAAATAASTAAAAAPSTRIGGVFSDDDLTDSDEGVMNRLGEFTGMVRRTAVHNEELSRELADEKRRVAHTSRKLEQTNSTCAELRETLALAQDTVIKLREHEIRWAESTASEMSLRAEVCALKDEHNSVVGDAVVLRKRCEVLQRENNELGERFAAMAEEKRQVETRARRLLRSDRYRGGY